MSEVKVNKITPRAACGTTQLGDSGDTFTIPSGATISNLGTATGFGGTGVVSWDTGSIKTVDFTAVTGTGYFVDTATTGEVEVTLPLSPAAGDVVGVSDYAKNFNTANCILLRNGSNIGGSGSDSTLETAGAAVTLVYVDATKGWIVTDSGNQTDAPTAAFVTATGGCESTCGDYKTHTFQSPGTFCVSAIGNVAGSTTVDYMILAGGGAGQTKNVYNPVGSQRYAMGGGGAGGWRASAGTGSGCYTAGPSPLTAPVSPVTVSATPYAILVGGGGGAPSIPQSCTTAGPGNVSSFNSIVATGGGGGGYGSPAPIATAGANGGSGGGGGAGAAGGSGNTPTVSPAQGSNGGLGTDSADTAAGGGGGAGAVGVAGTGSPSPRNNVGGNGGAGVTSDISFSPIAYAGGGGGGVSYPNEGGGAQTQGTGGLGGGGAGGHKPNSNGLDGTQYLGGGGGGAGGDGSAGSCGGGGGGDGVVIIRYKYK